MNPDTEFDGRSGFGAAVATALRECAEELTVQPDESGLMSALTEREMAALHATDLHPVSSTPSKQRFGWMAAAAALLLLAGCAPAATQTASPTGGGSAPMATPTIGLTSIPNVQFSPFYLA
mgnify:CR=1 FL=1